MIKKSTQHDDTEVQQAAYEVQQIFANIEHIPGKENFIADFLSQKEKSKKIDETERLLVGIIDDHYIVV
jgi:hypothetical protein